MDGLSMEAWSAGGAFAVLVMAWVLWKVLKLTLKLVLFVVVAAALAAGVAAYLKNDRPALPVPAPRAGAGVSASPVPG